MSERPPGTPGLQQSQSCAPLPLRHRGAAAAGTAGKGQLKKGTMLSSHSSLLLHPRGSLENFTREITFLLQCSEQKASHFPALPFRLNPSLPDTGPFGIHPLHLFWISAAASASRAWKLLYLFIEASGALGFAPAGGKSLPEVCARLGRPRCPIQGHRAKEQ